MFAHARCCTTQYAPFIFWLMASKADSCSEYDFVEKPGDEFFCPVSFDLLKDPRQANTCCGKHFSRAVAERLEAERKKCPHCNDKPLKTVEDRSFKQKVMALNVRCNNKGSGCEWVGALSDLDKHLNLGSVDGKCDFVAVECPLNCGKRIQRRYLAKHKSNECSKRPFSCKYCDYQATHEKIVNNHWPKCQRYPEICPNGCSTEEIERRFFQRHLKKECPLQEIECDFSYAGCKKKMIRRLMKKHLDESKDEHLKMTTEKCKKLEAVVNDLQLALSQISTKPIFIPPPDMIMDHFETHKNDDTRWYSPPFNTHVGGYKMCLKVTANGWGSGKGTHVSLGVNLMKREFDSHLQWPFKGEITVELVNQKEGGENLIRKPLAPADYDKCYKNFQRVTEGERASGGWGFSTFIAHTDLYKPEENKEYLLNDTLIFRVTNVEVTSL